MPADAVLPLPVTPPAFALTGLDTVPDPGAVLALPVLPGPDAPLVGPGAEAIPDDLVEVLAAHGASGRPGEVTLHATPDGPTALVALVGVGEATPDELRRAGAALGRALRGRDEVVSTLTRLADDDGLRAFVVGLTLASFRFHWGSDDPAARPVRRVVLADDTSRSALLDRAVAIAAAAWRARTLATTPSNLKNPGWLAAQAADAAAAGDLRISVMDEVELAERGFGGILAVGRASATPPRLIRLDYRPRRARGHVVLVGKGITFDTGGLSIKPAEAMVNMKRDMTGGAVVIATLSALAAVGCTMRVTGLVPAAENAISGSAFRPGDVVRHYGGRTTEVTNTDAEGRLVLADALAHAVADLEPDAIVDVATLTGAMKVALGLRTGGLFANDDTLAQALLAAGEGAGERLWRMPLAPDYEEKLSSKVADADNAPGGPGAIIAALFLQHFTGNVPWAHLDIASVGDAPEAWDEWTAGPTGFGVRTLLHWLASPNPLAGIR